MESIDRLPPEARFLLRTLSAGRPLADAAALLDLDATEAGRRLRAAAARERVDVPGTAAGPDALLAALAPLVDAAARPPAREPATSCPSPDVLRSLALHRLAGPLLLATAEHAADCPACLETVLAPEGEGEEGGPATPTRRGRKQASAVSFPVVALVALAAGWLLLVVLLLFA